MSQMKRIWVVLMPFVPLKAKNTQLNYFSHLIICSEMNTILSTQFRGKFERAENEG